MSRFGKKNVLIIAVALLCAGAVCTAEVSVPSADPQPPTLQTATTAANVQDPIAMLKQVTSEVLLSLQQSKRSGGNGDKNIYAIVDRYILPHVDFNEMSLWIAGRTAWGKASEQNRAEFVVAFKTLVIRTYAKALYNYSDEKVEFANQKVDLSKDRIQIASKIIRQGKENVRVDFRLVKRDGQWYVYDLIIEGVSILQGFQAQFSDEIRQKGLVPVIAQIRAHNAKTDV